MKSEYLAEQIPGVPRIGFLDHRPYLLWLMLVLIFLAAFFVRTSYFESSRAVGEVQYRSALIARSFFFARTASIPDWRRQVNADAVHRMPTKEPSITEFLTAMLYWLFGREDLWLARMLTTSFWLAGGAILFVIVRNTTSLDAAIVACAYFLFVPIGVFLSTSFQPDSLMIMVFLASLLALLQYGQKPTFTRLLISGGISGLAVLVKPLCVFAIGVAFLALLIAVRKDLKGRLVVHLLIFSIIFASIGTGYYWYGLLVVKDLMGQAESSFFPILLLSRQYWSGWILTATNTVGTMPLVVALLGIPMLRNKVWRGLTIGLWIGYVIFCLVFTYHIRFNSYYHAQLIVLVALSIGPIVTLVFDYLRELRAHRFEWVFVLATCTLIAYLAMRGVRDLFQYQAPIEGPETAFEIGQKVAHSSKTVSIASYYGRPLMYLGEISGVYWPRPVTEVRTLRESTPIHLSIDDRLEAIDFSPEYFIITDFEEFNHNHADLEVFLTANCVLDAQQDAYLIYGNCNLFTPQPTTPYAR